MTAEERIEHIVNRCNRSIYNMFAAPAMWGSKESLELQFVTVVEMREEALGNDVKPREIYRELLKKHFNSAKFSAAENFGNEQSYTNLLSFLREFLTSVESGGKGINN